MPMHVAVPNIWPICCCAHAGCDWKCAPKPAHRRAASAWSAARRAPVAHKEGYSLEVDAKGVRIAARDGAGLLYGAVSAWQLMTPDTHKGEVQLPSVAIRDWPRFSWRGQHLDVARHFS